MDKEQIISIRKYFGFSTREFSKILGIGEYTLLRWEMGESKATTLRLEVLQALYNIINILKTSNNKEDKERVTSILKLGLGAYIFITTMDMLKIKEKTGK